ncbi:inter-alpha-trypsin inhibitor heavy chain H5 [Lagopus leucura]|uniref:inter-alpha-trypsin inhibitor heavy chain H5 n=1 Tax=Lagopus leucura TaxID=30410 RepID=UPI001C680CBF|nr:inter-alpha-trypsin inhibitor heavy chain H5 [Lagopus leucura]
MILWLWLCCCFPAAVGQPDSELMARYLEEKLMADYSVAEQVVRRVPRQTRFLQRLETRPRMSEFSVKSTIISRYAFTTVSCTMVNSGSEAREAVFEMQIPAAAFISNFTMSIGNKTYYGEVTGKEKKHSNDDKAKTKKPPSPVNGRENGYETFKASVFIPRKMQANFLLHYEELLQRRLGKYEYMVSIRPQQLVGRLRVEVNILENSGIISLEVPPLRNSKHKGNGKAEGDVSPPPSTVIGQTKTLAKVTFSPNVVEQTKIARNGILGDFIVRYDVNRELSVGDVQILNGYFVHYFAPMDLPPLPKNVVFVLDSSASMVGTKLKQTKEALFTILQDLRPEDHFNIIGFSNRIKVWQQDRLVPVTPNNIRDAKKYIHNMSPTGGTNINSALQTGAKLLNDYIAQNNIDARSVSLIIFLTDGRPTVGETQSSKILSNTKDAIRDKFCLFTIGIGNDVDYKLLERMALENCGMVRHFQEDEDAANHLKGFYDEIGTPLLSDIRIDYPEDNVEQVTQNFFPNYFNGSEIIIAGKLINRTSDSLHVEVTASNSKKYILLKTDVAIDLPSTNDIRAVPGLEDGRADQNYIERAWSYLTIKELLNSRLKSNDNQEKEYLTEKAKSMALAYNFVTPFTYLKMREAGLHSEPPHEELISPSTDGIGEKLQSLQGHKAPPGIRRHQDKQRIKISKTSADGDPHFVIDFPSSKFSVCFNIDGEPGDILRLVSDHKESGVTVNGQLIGAPAPPNGHKKHRTYFNTITILSNKPERSYLEITPTRIILDDGERLILSCDRNAVVRSSSLEVSISANSNITVTIRDTISFVILIHRYKKPAPYQKDHLGFYISNSKGLSSDSHGLLGQFLSHEVKLLRESLNINQQQVGQNQTEALQPNLTNTLKVKGRLVPVVWKQRRIYNGQQQVDCWFAKNNADKLIDGSYKDYLASHPFDTGTSPGTRNSL